MKKLFLCYLLLTTYSLQIVHAQSDEPGPGKLLSLPKHWVSRIEERIGGLNQQLTKQTTRYLTKMAAQEEKLQQKLAPIDPASANTLFAGTAKHYAGLTQQLKTDTGSPGRSFSGAYQPYLDSLHGSLAFLQQHPELLNGSPARLAQLQKASSQLQALEARMQDAEQIKGYLQQRKQQIGQYISQHANAQSLLTKQYAGINRQVYYYSQQVRGYKELWNYPDALEQRALTLLNGTAGFTVFMKTHSSLGGLFQVNGSYASPQGLTGLQTKEAVAAQVQGKVSAGGTAGPSALQSSLQTAQSALDSYKAKLSTLGTGNGDMDMPDFQPNDQHTKTFWRRLEYGTSFQTARTNYYFPTVTDLGLSLGYRLGHNNIVGIGASYKLGWGNGIQHIAFSSQGIGLRSFLQIRIKGTFSATGGFEYNYMTPFPAFSQLPRLQDWTRSGLIGGTKTITMKNRVFKKTSVSLLWDFLSYQQVPQTQPLLFRIGYVFN